MKPQDRNRGTALVLDDDTMPSAPLWKILVFAIFNTGMVFSLVFVTGMLMPLQLVILVGDEHKAIALGIISALSAVCNVSFGLITGFLSDKMGRRRLPFIYVGVLLWAVTVATRSLFVEPNNTLYIVLYTLLTVFGKGFHAMATVCYAAMMPDLFPKRQYGTISGLIGTASFTSLIASLGLFGFIIHVVNVHYLCTGIAIAAIALSLPLLFFARSGSRMTKSTTYSVVNSIQSNEAHDILAGSINEDIIDSGSLFESTDTYEEKTPLLAGMDHSIPIIEESVDMDERPVEMTTKSINMSGHVKSALWGYIKPFTHWDYFWVFFTRFLMNLGQSSTQGYFLYFMRDMYTYPISLFGIFDDIITSPEMGMSVVMLNMTICGAISTVCGGVISNYAGRKLTITVAGCMSAVATIVMVFSLNIHVMIVAAMFVGAGFGAFLSVDVALANEVLPNPEERGKDLSIFAQATNIPQIISGPIGGGLVTLGGYLATSGLIPIAGLGYWLLYSYSASLTFIGSALVMLVRYDNRKAKQESTACVASDSGTTSDEDEIDQSA